MRSKGRFRRISMTFRTSSQFSKVFGQSVRKNLLGEFHRYTADGGGAAADKSACADLLRHLECLLEHTVQNAACKLRRTGELVSFFDLSGDFRLAKHH